MVFLTYVIVLKDARCQLPNYNLASVCSWVNPWRFREWLCNTSDNISYCAPFKSLFRGYFLSSLQSIAIHFVYRLITQAFTQHVNEEALWQWISPKGKHYNLNILPDSYIHFRYTYTLFVYICSFVNSSVLSIYKDILFFVASHRKYLG